MFCVGFGSSLTASAASDVPFVVEVHSYDEDSYIFYGSSAVQIDTSLSNSPSLEFDLVVPSLTTSSYTDVYYVFTVVSHTTYGAPVKLSFEFFDDNNNLLGVFYDEVSNVNVNSITRVIDTRFVANGLDGSKISRVLVKSVWPSHTSSYSETILLTLEKFYTSVDGSLNSVVAAIQNQTSDLQQSIQDQYGGDPGSSFPVDDIISQHNEKMGVLSFSSDALMQVLGLLSPDQTLSSELVFPSMSLTIAGQRNKVQLWPEYRFDLNTLKQHWPDFVGIMQSLTTALVWIFVLRYCYRVFEKYFLAGGGS